MSNGLFGTIGGTAAQVGMAAGVFGPWAMPIGLGIGALADTFMGGKQEYPSAKSIRKANKPRKEQWRKNERYAENAADEYNRHSMEMWQFGVDQTAAQVSHAQQKREDAIYNYEQDKDYNLKIATQRRDYAVAEQQHQFDVNNRAYEKSLETAEQKLNFNTLTASLANQQQSQYLSEQLTSLQFDQSQTLLEYTAASAGLNLKKQQAKTFADIQLETLQQKSDLAMETVTSKAAFAQRDLGIAQLKAAGQAAARGQAGRSAAKAQQAVVAEAGAQKAQVTEELTLQQRQIMGEMLQNQRNIVTELLFTEASSDLDLMKLDNQLELDRAKIEASRGNLFAKDAVVRKQISLQKQQADMNAKASIMLKPELGPEIPPVVELPDRKFTEVFVPGEPPKPIKLTKEAFGGGQPEPTQRQIKDAINAGMPPQPSFGGQLMQNLGPQFFSSLGTNLAGMFNQTPNLGGDGGILGIDFNQFNQYGGLGNLDPQQFPVLDSSIYGLGDFNLNPYEAVGFAPTQYGFS